MSSKPSVYVINSICPFPIEFNLFTFIVISDKFGYLSPYFVLSIYPDFLLLPSSFLSPNNLTVFLDSFISLYWFGSIWVFFFFYPFSVCPLHSETFLFGLVCKVNFSTLRLNNNRILDSINHN